uniref:myosin-binding protein C, cardiac-type-like isoform X2 n=1 Tax=Myxine glutinosa TaxID=7769 RepID=UPI00358FE6CA
MTKSPFKLSIKDPVPTPDKKTPAEPVPPSEPDVLPQMKEERDTLQTMAGLFLEKIEDAHVHVGGDHLFTAKVDGSKFTTRPQVQWFKGKWMDLSSKAGKHLQFKDTFDKNTKIYTFEMNMIKAKEMHTGKYRCEISHKGTKDSCSFDVNITAPLGEEMDIRKAFKRVGKEKKEDAGEMDFSALLKKREKKVVEEPNEPSDDVWEILKNAKPSEFERIAFEHGITDLRGLLKRLKKMRAPVKSEVILKKLEPAYQVDKGGRIRFEIEVADPNVDIKWLKNGKPINLSGRIAMEAIGARRMLTLNKCTLGDDAAYEVVVGDERCATELFVREPAVLIVTQLEDQTVTVEERVELECEVSEEGAAIRWEKDGVELTGENTFKYRMKKIGKKLNLIINSASKEDAGHYKVITNGGESIAELVVQDKKLEVLQGIADLTVKAEDSAEFTCEVSDEKVTGKWLKNGIEVVPSERIKLIHRGRIHKLMIENVRPEDEGDYTFIPDGYAFSLSAKLNMLEVKIEYVPKQEPPKIHLDCHGKQSENSITVVAGNKLRLNVPITGEPPPTVIWHKGEQVLTDTEGRVFLENQKDSSALTIEGAERDDEATYKICVQNPSGEDKATLFIKVVDVPDPPRQPQISEVGEDCCTVSWETPKYDGGMPITGYLLERKKTRSHRWIKLSHNLIQETSFECKKMIEGIAYEIRIYAVNEIGMSIHGPASKPFIPLAPTSEPTRLGVDDVTDTTVTLKWRRPDKVGAGGVDGYLIEYCREGDTEWVAVNKEPVERTSLHVKDLPTGEKLIFRVRAINSAGLSPPATMSQPVLVREIVERPRIRLPRHLRHTYIRQVGQTINQAIPFQGKPRPKVTWQKDEQPLDTERVSICNSVMDTIFFIRHVERSDSGVYNLKLDIDHLEDQANIKIRVVEKPGPPQIVKVVEVWGFNVALKWMVPRDDGNTEITGYTIQKADRQTMTWFTVYEHYHRTSCTVSDLIMGNDYYFRVFSENIVGRSETACQTKEPAHIDKTGVIYKAAVFKEYDFTEPPNFTHRLPDRTAVAGYNCILSCSVRGNPKPKVKWLKNGFDITEEPKYRMLTQQGVCTLEIRKPMSSEGGVYTCMAENALGEANIECKLEVKVLPKKKVQAQKK